jgi:hypothetical protein
MGGKCNHYGGDCIHPYKAVVDELVGVSRDIIEAYEDNDTDRLKDIMFDAVGALAQIEEAK